MPTFGKVLNLTKDRWVNYWGDVMNQLQYLICAISGEELTCIVQQRGDLLKQLGCYSQCYRVD